MHSIILICIVVSNTFDAQDEWRGNGRRTICEIATIANLPVDNRVLIIIVAIVDIMPADTPAYVY